MSIYLCVYKSKCYSNRMSNNRVMGKLASPTPYLRLKTESTHIYKYSNSTANKRFFNNRTLYLPSNGSL